MSVIYSLHSTLYQFAEFNKYNITCNYLLYALHPVHIPVLRKLYGRSDGASILHWHIGWWVAASWCDTGNISMRNAVRRFLSNTNLHWEILHLHLCQHRRNETILLDIHSSHTAPYPQVYLQ